MPISKLFKKNKLWRVNLFIHQLHTYPQCAKYHNEIFKTLWTTIYSNLQFFSYTCLLYLSEYSSSYLFEKSRSSSRWGAVNDEDMKNESPARGRISMSSPASVRRTDGAHRTTKPKCNYKYKYYRYLCHHLLWSDWGTKFLRVLGPRS